MKMRPREALMFVGGFLISYAMANAYRAYVRRNPNPENTSRKVYGKQGLSVTALAGFPLGPPGETDESTRIALINADGLRKYHPEECLGI